MTDNRKWIITAGILGFLGVAIGAFGAHGLKNYLTPEMHQIYETGVFYHLVHTVVVLVIGLSGQTKYSIAALFFTIGIVLFSFSLYLYSLTAITAFAIITPLGGVSFLIGWVLLIIKAAKKDVAEKKEI